jgi:cytochrome c-type biogenesis protein CcmH/NrfG
VALTSFFRRVAGQPPTTVQMFRQASRFRTEGRFEEAADLVKRGLQQDPDSIVGHLLAGSLHAVFREMELAKAAFERVLALDHTHPRAMLGLAQIAVQEGASGTAGELLKRALTHYPDFPEARALLDVVNSIAGTPPRSARTTAAVRLDRLRVPSENRELLIARIDATLILAQPRGARTEELAGRTAQLCRMAGAMLSRAGLGGLKQVVIEGAAETTFMRADGEVVLSLAFSRDTEIAAGLAHLERVWANCRSELASAVA